MVQQNQEDKHIYISLADFLPTIMLFKFRSLSKILFSLMKNFNLSGIDRTI